MKKKRRDLVLEHVEITDAGSEGKAVGKYNNKVVFVPFAVPGDVVDVEVLRQKSSFYEGRALKFHTLSSRRVEPACRHFGVCGGCKWQNMSYLDQLFFKQKQVLDNLQRIGKVDTAGASPIIPSPEIFNYRSKLEYTFLNKRWLTTEEIQSQEKFDMNGLGFHVPGRFDRVIDIRECLLQKDPSNAIRNSVREYALSKQMTFYSVWKWEGFLRNLIIRNTTCGEWMVIMVFRDNDPPAITDFMEYISRSFPAVNSLYYVVNDKRNATLYGLDFIHYKGNPWITEKMEDISFRIGPQSFFQTNPVQALTLYRIARKFANLKGDEVVYDLYSGAGTIANFVAPVCRKVVGIETVDRAVDDARQNAQLNKIENAFFYAGEMEKILHEGFIAENGKPDVVITDPPRAGMHESVVQKLTEIAPQRIVYISCNPATQARDIARLGDFYTVSKIQPVDMFPHTQHVENVVELCRK
ncbi:MAG: 23S rRNA (uracil(1939)-C(5))-methyltransferase RlmD [Bacteroidales bacterium]|nr:23S rRNA (uracil(1939)-C(5))-methyltransferase RlmD [Bacteroidales bacterium]